MTDLDDRTTKILGRWRANSVAACARQAKDGRISVAVRQSTIERVSSGSNCEKLARAYIFRLGRELGHARPVALHTKKKGRLRCHKRPKSREETPKEGSGSGMGLGAATA
jgi:hypothetical protein